MTGRIDSWLEKTRNRGSFEVFPVIPAIRRTEDIDAALASPAEVVFLMTGDIFEVAGIVQSIQNSGKAVLVHADLIKGIAHDKEGITYICKEVQPDGIISTKAHLLHVAKKAKLFTVQHLFLIDTQAFETGLRHIKESKADAIELMPGLMPRVIRELLENTDRPVFAAGMIKTFREVQEAIEAGARAAVVGKKSLWSIEEK